MILDKISERIKWFPIDKLMPFIRKLASLPTIRSRALGLMLMSLNSIS